MKRSNHFAKVLSVALSFLLVFTMAFTGKVAALDPLLFSDDFSSGDLSKWTQTGGSWAVSGGSVTVLSGSTASLTPNVANIAEWAVTTVTAEVKVTTGQFGFEFLDSSGTLYRVTWNQSQTQFVFYKGANIKTPVKASALTLGNWYLFTLTIGSDGGYGLSIAPVGGGTAVSDSVTATQVSNTGTAGKVYDNGPVRLYSNSTPSFTNVNVYGTIVQKTAPMITTTTLPNAVAGGAYSQTLKATGSAPITWSIDAGSALPAWLSLNTSTGVISGTPAAADVGTASFTVKAANGTLPDATQALSITTDAFIAVTDITGVPTAATVGVPLALTGTAAPANATNKTVTWTVKTAGTTGAAISGGNLTATGAGTVTVTATVKNGATAATDFTKDFDIAVSALAAPAAPANVTLLDNHSTGVNLTFDLPTGDAITSYKVYNGGALYTEIKLVPTNPAESYYTLVNGKVDLLVSGLTRGSTYSFTVSAVNNAGESAQSAAAVPYTVQAVDFLVGGKGPFMGIASHTEPADKFTAAETIASLQSLFDNNPLISQVSLKIPWDRLHPTKDNLDLGLLETYLQICAAHGATANLVILPGYSSPEWIYKDNGGTAERFVLDATSTSPFPWDPAFLTIFKADLAAIAAKYADDPRLYAVSIQGHTFTGEEMHAPAANVISPQSETLLGVPVTKDLILNTFKDLMQTYGDLFPNKKLIMCYANGLYTTYDVTYTTTYNTTKVPLSETVLNYFVMKFQGRAIIQHDQQHGRGPNQNAAVENVLQYYAKWAATRHEMVGSFKEQPYRQGNAAMTVYNFLNFGNPNSLQLWRRDCDITLYAQDLLDAWTKYGVPYMNGTMTLADVAAAIQADGQWLDHPNDASLNTWWTGPYSGFYATAVTDTSVTLEWFGAGPGNGWAINDYALYCDGALVPGSYGGAYTLPGESKLGATFASGIPGGLNSYTVTGLTPGTSYHFEIKNTSKTDVMSVLNLTLGVTTKTASDAPLITTATLPDSAVGTAYSQAIDASGAGSVTWSVDSGALPGGLTLDPNGVISGTPTTAGIFNFTVKAENSAGSATAAFSIVTAAAPVAPPAAIAVILPDGAVATPYFTELDTDGAAPINWSIVGGDFPAGLSLSPSGVISGTPAANEAGTHTFTVSAANGAGGGTQTITITIAAAPVIPAISMTALPGAGLGAAYSQTIAATGTAPIIWSVSAGSLPTGLILTAATGEISGTPTATGIFNFTVKAANGAGSATKDFSIAVTTIVPPSVSIGALPNGTVGAYYNQTLTATGTAPITWEVVSGSLPVGMALNTTTGVISGTPTAPGTYTFTVKATNAAGSATKQLTLTVDLAAAGPGTGGGGGIGGGGGLSTSKGVSTVYEPQGATVNGNTITATVGSGVDSTPIYMNTDPGSTYKVYRDAACANEITGPVALAAGLNTVYVKVTAQDGNSTVYTFNIMKAAASSSSNNSGSGSNAAGPDTKKYAGSTQTFSGNGTRTFKIDADLSKFLRLLYNGEVAKTNYDLASGSTVITLKESYLKTFDPGTYVLRAEFTDGYADLTLVVDSSKGNPGTGDTSGLTLMLWIFGAAVFGLSGLAVARKRRCSGK